MKNFVKHCGTTHTYNSNQLKRSEKGITLISLVITIIILLILSVIAIASRSEEHTSELQSHSDLVCRLLLEKKLKNGTTH